MPSPESFPASSPEVLDQPNSTTTNTGPEHLHGAAQNIYINTEKLKAPEAQEKDRELEEASEEIGEIALDSTVEVRASVGGEDDEGVDSSEEAAETVAPPETKTGAGGGGEEPPDTTEAPPSPEDDEDEAAEPIGFTGSGEPIYAIHELKTHDDGSEWVRVTTKTHGRLPDGRPDWSDVTFGEKYIPKEGLPAELLEGHIKAEAVTPTSPSSPDVDARLIARAVRRGISESALRKAVESGYEDPLETLIQAQTNEGLRQTMVRLGFDISPPAKPFSEDTTEELPDDQFVEQQLIGDRRRLRVKEIEQQIRNNPSALRRSLSRPGFLGIQRLPFLGPPVARYFLSWSIYNKQRRSRSNEPQNTGMKDAHGDDIKARKNFDDGLFGWGHDKRKVISDTIKGFDHKVIVARGKLGLLERRTYQSDEIASRRFALAEQIEAIEEQGAALSEKLLNPEDAYSSERRKRERKAHDSHPSAPEIRERILDLDKRRKDLISGSGPS